MAAPEHDWYAKQWLDYFGKKQRDMVADLDWNKSRASLMVRGLQGYDRKSINELAAYLSIEPFELLLPPDRAMSYRQLRASAEQIMTLTPEPETPPETNVANLHDEKFRRRKEASKSRKPPRATGTND